MASLILRSRIAKYPEAPEAFSGENVAQYRLGLTVGSFEPVLVVLGVLDANDGDIVGPRDGSTVGDSVGNSDDGDCDGTEVSKINRLVGALLGSADGPLDGLTIGTNDGSTLGL